MHFLCNSTYRWKQIPNAQQEIDRRQTTSCLTGSSCKLSLILWFESITETRGFSMHLFIDVSYLFSSLKSPEEGIKHMTTSERNLCYDFINKPLMWIIPKLLRTKIVFSYPAQYGATLSCHAQKIFQQYVQAACVSDCS